MATPSTPRVNVFSEFRKHSNTATGRTQFRIQGIDLSIVNGLRRTILTDIPTVGLVFEGDPTVVIKKNTGPLHNEFLVHRMSMIPIHLTEEEVETYEPRSIRFEIQKTNSTTTMQNLTTHDMELIKDNQPLTVAEIHRLFPANAWSKTPILITRLRSGETIQMNGEFVKSTARVNAGFSPVSLCSFTPEIDAERVKSERITNVLERERAFKKNDYGDPIAWLFEIEPENGLPVDYLVAKAFQILISKVQQARQTLTTDALEVLPHEVVGTYEYVFRDEDDTLGHLIQGYIHNTYYRPERLIQHRFRVSFVGYLCPHPLEAKMHVRLTLRPPKEERTGITEESVEELVVRDFLKQSLTELQSHLEDLYRQWCRFTGRPEPLSLPLTEEPTEPVEEPELEPVEPPKEPEPEPVVEPEPEPVVEAPPPKKRAPAKKKVVAPKETTKTIDVEETKPKKRAPPKKKAVAKADDDEE